MQWVLQLFIQVSTGNSPSGHSERLGKSKKHEVGATEKSAEGGNRKEFVCYGTDFRKVDTSPSGDKKKVLSWMKKHFKGLSEKPEPQNNRGRIFFFDGDVMAFDTDSDGEVYLVECTAKQKTTTQRKAKTAGKESDASKKAGKTRRRKSATSNAKGGAIFFGDAPSIEEILAALEEESPDPKMEIGGKKYRLRMSETAGGWSLDGIDPLPAGKFAIPAEIDGRTIVALGNETFRNAKKLVSLEMPDTITTIKGQVFYGAFTGCTALKSVRFSQNLKELGSGTFGDCTALESIVLPDSLEKIGNYVFADDTSLKSVKMPQGIEKLVASVFKGCTSLVRIEFPDGLRDITQDIFKGCKSLREVVFPSTFDPYGLGAGNFAGCANLRRVVFKAACPEDYDDEEFKEDVFDESPKVKIVFENGIERQQASKKKMKTTKSAKKTTSRKKAAKK